MTCELCRQKDRRIAQLERDLEEAAQGVDLMTRKWLEAKEAKEKKK
jgi:hypothetical protein